MDPKAGDVNEGVDRLVSEIDRAVGLIEHLRRENTELKQQRGALEETVAQQKGELEALCQDRDRLQQIYNDHAVLIAHKQDIQDKVEAMLHRLESLGLDVETEVST